MENRSVYLFDFDGTLVDSMPSWAGKMLHVLQTQGVEPPAGLIQTITPLGDAGTARYFREELGVDLSDAEMFARMDEYALPKYRNEIAAKEGVADYLRALRRRGASIALLTASPHRMFEPCLARLGLTELFDALWSCDDFGLVKSDPAIYRAALARLGASAEQAYFFDDNLTALKTAASAGLGVIGVYDASSASCEDAIRAVSDRYIRSFSELLSEKS